MLGKNFSRHFEIFFLYFLEHRIWHSMQNVSLGNYIFTLSSAESAYSVVTVNEEIMKVHGFGVLIHQFYWIFWTNDFGIHDVSIDINCFGYLSKLDNMKLTCIVKIYVMV